MEKTRAKMEVRLKELEVLIREKDWELADAERDELPAEERDTLLEELGGLAMEEQELREELFPACSTELEKDNIHIELQEVMAKALVQRARGLLAEGDDPELVKKEVLELVPKGTFLACLFKVRQNSPDPILDIITSYGKEN